MFIKSIIIDGFKSYGTRTEINGFDPQFNAITGLNGTGKSNILDSICFVLGITNISLVRAGSLQDLIYKSGQAGVTKASVTIVFDNSDTSKSPINYEQCKEITVCRQIVVGGKNRYMINGVNTAPKQVQDFFNGIQLNVNNPHFLIMQGRITKVLNMKPPEILSMIEEAAGTRMYESKKHDAQRTIEKKDGRLKEINEMVTEHINPKLQKMKDEQDLYNEYSRIVRDLDIYVRITSAWQYLQTEASQKKFEESLEEVNNHLKGLHENIATKKTRIKELEGEISEIQAILDKESGGELQVLETALKESEKVEAKDSALVKSAKETISASTKHIKQLQKSVDDDEKALAQKEAELGKLQSFFASLKEACEQDAEAFAAAQRKLQAVSSGLLENEDGENASLQDQLMTAKQIVTEHETEIKKSMMKIQQDKKELDSKKPLLKKTEMAFANDKKDLDLKEKELKGLRENLSKCNYQEGHLENLQGKYRELHSAYRDRCEIVNNFSHRYPFFNFQYTDPEPNFDRRKVRGLLCKLFKIKDEKFARAIESAAGGKLYNVVVDNEVISAKLIEKGRLAKRTTFAPLNKIQGNYKIDLGTVKRAQSEYGADNVFLAQSLIEYNPEYENVMTWTFGQTLICSNIDVAEQICSRLKKKTITLDGDVFDPAGVISGGSVEKSQPVLLALIEFKKAEGALSEIKKEMDSVNEEIKRITPIATNYESMRERAEVCSREVGMVRARLEQTSHFQLQSELSALQTAIDENEAKIEQYKKEVKEKSVKVKELEDKMKNMHSIKEKALAAAEAEVKKAKKKADDSRNKWKQREQEFETLTLETQELKKSLQNGKDQIIKAEEGLAQNQEELKVKTEELNAKSVIVKEKKAAVMAKKEEISLKNSEIQKRLSEKTTLEKAISRGELDIIALGHSIEKCKKDIAETKQIMANLVKKYRWIETERQYFGTPGGKYDFSNYNPPELIEQIPRLQERRDKIAKSINVKAIDAIGNKEEGFHDVMNKKEIIEEDRSKILSVIEELDVKKEEVIRRAWDKVNHDFHSILSSLLPSAHAKLKPVDGKDFMHGLEVKVGFGGIWKDSLDELSGGQRSLVALSLILAMLLFKPAPLYILDEVDAALDPSHTQNIGQMLKTHFKQSQFIVVSLKDGMFNNANVLFRTAFVDGMSTVIRTTSSGKK